MSRMLVTDPKQRATMQEVLNHPWMTKGYNGPPDNYVPPREPLTLPLEPEVIHAMQGFNFGSPETINAHLTRIIESEEYQQAVRLYQRERDSPQPTREVEKKKSFSFDFYKRRNSATVSRDTLSVPSSDALQLGTDPLNAFSPLLSIYYLVREKQGREQETILPTPAAAVSKDKEKQREKEREREVARAPDAMPELAPPQAAHTNAAAFEMPGEKPTGGRTRPRARTHGEDEEPEITKQTQQKTYERDKLEPTPKKEGAAAGLLRRFSTRKRREPQRHERDRSHPPTVHVHSPADSVPAPPRKSFSIRRSRREEDEVSSTPSRSQHQKELLSPPMSAGGRSNKSGLGRSTSVNSADLRRRETTRPATRDHAVTSGSDQSVENDQSGFRGHNHSRSMTVRAKSLGHARRESVQQRRLRREAALEADVPEETDLEAEQSGLSTERLASPDLAKPVFFKGLFSVSTTSGKSVPAIRAEIRRVLRQLNVEFTEIKGGFNCTHAPSIDLNKVQDPPGTPAGQSQGHRRRFSFGGLMRSEDREDGERPPMTPRTPWRDKERNDRDRSDRDRSFSNSETSVDSIPRRNGTRRLAPGETSTQVQSDLGGSMVLEFEIFIVKVPLLSLHGIQFKRMDGNTWQYKNMADQILRELKL